MTVQDKRLVRLPKRIIIPGRDLVDKFVKELSELGIGDRDIKELAYQAIEEIADANGSTADTPNWSLLISKGHDSRGHLTDLGLKVCAIYKHFRQGMYDLIGEIGFNDYLQQDSGEWSFAFVRFRVNGGIELMHLDTTGSG